MLRLSERRFLNQPRSDNTTVGYGFPKKQMVYPRLDSSRADRSIFGGVLLDRRPAAWKQASVGAASSRNHWDSYQGSSGTSSIRFQRRGATLMGRVPRDKA